LPDRCSDSCPPGQTGQQGIYFGGGCTVAVNPAVGLLKGDAGTHGNRFVLGILLSQISAEDQNAFVVGIAGQVGFTFYIDQAGCIGQLYKYAGGSLLIGKREVDELTKRDIAVNIGLVFQSPFIFDGTIEENLLYGSVSKLGPGNPDVQPVLPDLDQMIETSQQTGLFPDVLRFGLNSVLDNDAHGELIPRLIRIRKKLVRRLSAPLAEHSHCPGVFKKPRNINHGRGHLGPGQPVPGPDSNRSQYPLERENNSDCGGSPTGYHKKFQ